MKSIRCDGYSPSPNEKITILGGVGICPTDGGRRAFARMRRTGARYEVPANAAVGMARAGASAGMASAASSVHRPDKLGCAKHEIALKTQRTEQSAIPRQRLAVSGEAIQELLGPRSGVAVAPAARFGRDRRAARAAAAPFS